MKQYLLDTHTLLWMQDNSSQLSDGTRQILTDSKSRLYISIASFWEITIKSNIDKLELDYTIDEFYEACVTSDIVVLPIEISTLKQLQLLPFIHKDPFDRIIVSTAIDLNLYVIIRDDHIKQYSLDTFW